MVRFVCRKKSKVFWRGFLPTQRSVRDSVEERRKVCLGTTGLGRKEHFFLRQGDLQVRKNLLFQADAVCHDHLQVQSWQGSNRAVASRHRWRQQDTKSHSFDEGKAMLCRAASTPLPVGAPPIAKSGFPPPLPPSLPAS